jgi:hypothetical protein
VIREEIPKSYPTFGQPHIDARAGSRWKLELEARKAAIAAIVNPLYTFITGAIVLAVFAQGLFLIIFFAAKRLKNAIPGAPPHSNGASLRRRPLMILGRTTWWCIVGLMYSVCRK